MVVAVHHGHEVRAGRRADRTLIGQVFHRSYTEPAPVYAIPAEGGDRTPKAPIDESPNETRLARLCGELMFSAIDQGGLHEVIGTIACDGKVLLISRGPAGGQGVAGHLLQLAQS